MCAGSGSENLVLIAVVVVGSIFFLYSVGYGFLGFGFALCFRLSVSAVGAVVSFGVVSVFPLSEHDKSDNAARISARINEMCFFIICCFLSITDVVKTYIINSCANSISKSA